MRVAGAAIARPGRSGTCWSVRVRVRVRTAGLQIICDLYGSRVTST